jgi:hypothetical protein
MADPVQEFYVDQFKMTLTPYGATMTFGLAPAHPNPSQMEPPRDIVCLRMSLEHAKVMTMILKRNLKGYEDQMGAVNIPRDLLRPLGLSQEDW